MLLIIKIQDMILKWEPEIKQILWSQNTFHQRVVTSLLVTGDCVLIRKEPYAGLYAVTNTILSRHDSILSRHIYFLPFRSKVYIIRKMTIPIYTTLILSLKP